MFVAKLEEEDELIMTWWLSGFDDFVGEVIGLLDFILCKYFLVVVIDFLGEVLVYWCMGVDPLFLDSFVRCMPWYFCGLCTCKQLWSVRPSRMGAWHWNNNCWDMCHHFKLIFNVWNGGWLTQVPIMSCKVQTHNSKLRTRNISYTFQVNWIDGG